MCRNLRDIPTHLVLQDILKLHGLALLCIGLEVKYNADETLKQVQGDVKLVQVIGRIVQITGN
jgi:hypothetical protein